MMNTPINASIMKECYTCLNKVINKFHWEYLHWIFALFILAFISALQFAGLLLGSGVEEFVLCVDA